MFKPWRANPGLCGRCAFPESEHVRDTDAIYWNPYNKVVQDHRDGTIDEKRTNEVRARLGLRVPWTPKIGKKEVDQPPVFERESERERSKP